MNQKKWKQLLVYNYGRYEELKNQFLNNIENAHKCQECPYFKNKKCEPGFCIVLLYNFQDPFTQKSVEA